MVITLPALLALFTLLAIASGIYFLSQKLNIPYTVLLVAVGAFVLVPLSQVSVFSFLREFTLTPDLLFYIFLPVLIFESAYHINIRRFSENIVAISALSVVSLILSAFVIAGGLYIVLPYLGLELPFIVYILFGALISATDPVAVLALFKETGAPRRLTLLFEGESIFNDGTAVALFFVVLGIAVSGWHGTTTLAEGIFTFVFMVISGVVLGLLLGGLFVKAIDKARSNEFVQIALMITLAHFTFIFSDYLSQHIELAGHKLHISAIISTTIASMFIGNYGRAKILPHAQEFVEKFWSESALLTNSVVFLLIGLIFTALPVRLVDFVIPTIVAILIVAGARALSIYPVVGFLNVMKWEDHIPRSWQHLLAWGSLRGALAITMVLLIPQDLALPNWPLEYSPRDFILALTIGCIFTTLFLKATTITPLMRKLKVGVLTDLEHLGYGIAGALIHQRALRRLQRFVEKGYIDSNTATRLIREHNDRFATACATCADKVGMRGAELGERVLRMYAIGIEKEMLKTLYDYGEVDEPTYRRIMGKLTLQYESIEFGQGAGHPSTQTDHKDLFDRFVRAFSRGPIKASKIHESVSNYLYYRTQTVLSRTALNELAHFKEARAEYIFGDGAYDKVVSTYEGFLKGSTEKMHNAFEESPDDCSLLAERLARHSILEVESEVLSELTEREMITPKVQIAVQADINAQANRVALLDEHAALAE